VNICKAKDGTIICDQNEVLTWWNEHFDDLNKNNNQEHTAGGDEDIQPIEGPTVEDMDPPMFEELEEAIQKLKNNKREGAYTAVWLRMNTRTSKNVADIRI